MSKPTSSAKRKPSNGIGGKYSNDAFYRKLVFFFAGNLIPFEQVESTHFKDLLIFMGLEKSDVYPNYEVILEHANAIYSDYQVYFTQYFRAKSYKVSLTCHKWVPPTEINPFMFLNVHWIDENFQLNSVPLGLFEFEENTLATFLLRNTMLKEMKNSIYSITSNYAFNEKTFNLLDFSLENSVETKLFHCIPAQLACIVGAFFSSFSTEVQSGQTFNNTRIEIPSAVERFLGSIYQKFRSFSPQNIIPSECDADDHFYDCLTDYMMENERGFVLLKLESLLFYEKQIKEQTEMSEKDWAMIRFTVDLAKKFQDVVVASSFVDQPTVHMVLKWVKLLIIHTQTVLKRIKKYEAAVQIELRNGVCLILEKLTALHGGLENKFDLMLASYLHPSTKKFLKESHIRDINAYVAKAQETVQLTSEPDESLLDYANDGSTLEDLIMKTFDCSGKATKECYRYETSSTSEVVHDRRSHLVTKELGPFLLKFWQQHNLNYPTLSSMARDVLCIQTCTDGNMESFKNAFTDLQKSSQYLRNNPGDIQMMYFLHNLVNSFNVGEFDPKNHALDIHDFRIEKERAEFDDDEYDPAKYFLIKEQIELGHVTKRKKA